jgi:hypothetical protein
MQTNDSNISDGATPVRRDSLHRIRLDSKGQPFIEPVSSKTIFLSPEGSIDQDQVVNERFYDCCHNAEFPLGGCCGEPGCFKVSCINCFTRCSNCNVGLCLYHARRSEIDGQSRVFCSHCREALLRHRFWRGFWRTILRPFVTFDDSK